MNDTTRLLLALSRAVQLLLDHEHERQDGDWRNREILAEVSLELHRATETMEIAK